MPHVRERVKTRGSRVQPHWNWLAITQYILGIRPTYDGLEIDPCLPKTMKEYTVRRKLRNSEFTITVKNPNGKQKGVSRINR